MEKIYNGVWRKVLPEDVLKEPLKRTKVEFQETVRNIVDLARSVGDEGFTGMQEPEVLDMMMPTVDLSVEELEQIATPIPEAQAEKESSVISISGKMVVEIVTSLQKSIDLAMKHDLIMTSSLQFKINCENAVELYQELHRDILRRAKQTHLTDFFRKNN